MSHASLVVRRLSTIWDFKWVLNDLKTAGSLWEKMICKKKHEIKKISNFKTPSKIFHWKSIKQDSPGTLHIPNHSGVWEDKDVYNLNIKKYRRDRFENFRVKRHATIATVTFQQYAFDSLLFYYHPIKYLAAPAKQSWLWKQATSIFRQKL